MYFFSQHPKWLQGCLGALLGCLLCVPVLKAHPLLEPTKLERSFWVHVSLGLLTQKGYFGAEYPASESPTREQVQNAVDLLCREYAANRLYLIYHKEIPLEQALEVFTWWRQFSPPTVEIVPALLMRMYDLQKTAVFEAAEIERLGTFFETRINAQKLAILDIYARRDQTVALARLAERFPQGLIRIGLQPGEPLAAPFVAAVQDTWSGVCHGTRNQTDWAQPGFGAETLKQWVLARATDPKPVAWNLITVAWDYSATERGGFPGYDDADKNMPLPAGRNVLAAQLIARHAPLNHFAGFSSDLYILNENSRSEAHDGRDGAFYQTLRAGQVYTGYYATPFNEIVTLYRALRAGEFSADQALHLHLPFDDTWFVMQGGDTLNVNHHMQMRSQWYGLDFLRVGGARGRELHRAHGQDLDDYYSWGAAVRAPTHGVVHKVVDGLPDNQLGVKDPVNPAGNHVVLKVAEQKYIFIAHFQKDGVLVKVGQRVEPGTLLGRCGNSGNSDLPHIHMHMQDAPEFGQGQGLNMTFTALDVELSGKQFENVSWPLIRGLFVANHGGARQ